MQFSVTFRKMDSSDSLKAYAAEKVERLKKYFDIPTDVNVILSKEKYRYIADIKVMARGMMLRGEDNSEDMYQSIDVAINKIERQARRYKEKIHSYEPVRLGEEIMVHHKVVDQEGLDDAEGPRIIQSSEFQAKPMSVDEAVMQMDLINNDFLVFTNAQTRDINVVYRRQDGNFGLIEAKTSAKAD